MPPAKGPESPRRNPTVLVRPQPQTKLLGVEAIHTDAIYLGH